MAGRSLVVVVAIAVVIGGCARPNESRQYRDAVTVDGYRKVIDADEIGALAIFVGPARDDVASAVHGPGGLKVDKSWPDLSDAHTASVGSGDGLLGGDVRCSVLVLRKLPFGSNLPYLYKGKLTEVEAAGVLAGTHFVLRISVLCDPQAKDVV